MPDSFFKWLTPLLIVALGFFVRDKLTSIDVLAALLNGPNGVVASLSKTAAILDEHIKSDNEYKTDDNVQLRQIYRRLNALEIARNTANKSDLANPPPPLRFQDVYKSN